MHALLLPLLMMLMMTQSPESFGNFFDAMYFSIMTLTSVGYGDIVPVTVAGKTVTSIAVLAYAVLIPYELALLAQTMGLMAGSNTDTTPQPPVEVLCRSCGTNKHEVREHKLLGPLLVAVVAAFLLPYFKHLSPDSLAP